MSKEAKIHLLVPAATMNFIRVACRARYFCRYTHSPDRVTCKHCRKTEAFKAASARQKS